MFFYRKVFFPPPTQINNHAELWLSKSIHLTLKTVDIPAKDRKGHESAVTGVLKLLPVVGGAISIGVCVVVSASATVTATSNGVVSVIASVGCGVFTQPCRSRAVKMVVAVA